MSASGCTREARGVAGRQVLCTVWCGFTTSSSILIDMFEETFAVPTPTRLLRIVRTLQTSKSECKQLCLAKQHYGPSSSMLQLYGCRNWGRDHDGNKGKSLERRSENEKSLRNCLHYQLGLVLVVPFPSSLPSNSCKRELDTPLSIHLASKKGYAMACWSRRDPTSLLRSSPKSGVAGLYFLGI